MALLRNRHASRSPRRQPYVVGLLRGLPVVVFSCSLALGAHAEPPSGPPPGSPPAEPRQRSVAEKDTARALLKAGMVLFEQGNHDGALKSFRAADLIMGVPSTRLWVGKTQEKVGQLLEARDTLLSIKRMAAEPQEPAAFVLAREEANQLARVIERRIPAIKLAIQGVPEGAELQVSIDGRAVMAALLDFPQRLNPGAHKIVVSIPGGKIARAISLQEGDVKTVALVLSPPQPQQQPTAGMDVTGAMAGYRENPYLAGQAPPAPSELRGAAPVGTPVTEPGAASLQPAGRPTAALPPSAGGTAAGGTAASAASAQTPPAGAGLAEGAAAGEPGSAFPAAQAAATTLPMTATPAMPATAAGDESGGVSPFTGLGFGIGTAGLLVGIATAGVAAARLSDIQSRCSSFDECEDSYRSSMSMVHASIGSSVFGLVFNAIGVGSLLLSGDEDERDSSTPPAMQLSPVVGGGMLGLSARFAL